MHVYVLIAPFIFRPEAGYWVSLNVPDFFLSLFHIFFSCTHRLCPRGEVVVVAALVWFPACVVTWGGSTRRYRKASLCTGFVYRSSRLFPSCWQLFSPQTPQLTTRAAFKLLSSYFMLFLWEKKWEKTRVTTAGGFGFNSWTFHFLLEMASNSWSAFLAVFCLVRPPRLSFLNFVMSYLRQGKYHSFHETKGAFYTSHTVLNHKNTAALSSGIFWWSPVALLHITGGVSSGPQIVWCGFRGQSRSSGVNNHHCTLSEGIFFLSLQTDLVDTLQCCESQSRSLPRKTTTDH